MPNLQTKSEIRTTEKIQNIQIFKKADIKVNQKTNILLALISFYIKIN